MSCDKYWQQRGFYVLHAQSIEAFLLKGAVEM